MFSSVCKRSRNAEIQRTCRRFINLRGLFRLFVTIVSQCFQRFSFFILGLFCLTFGKGIYVLVLYAISRGLCSLSGILPVASTSCIHRKCNINGETSTFQPWDSRFCRWLLHLRPSTVRCTFPPCILLEEASTLPKSFCKRALLLGDTRHAPRTRRRVDGCEGHNCFWELTICT